MKPKLTTLSNGLRIVTVPMVGNQTATVLVLVAAGSKYETKNISGLSHFLEHMCFKGTIKRPTALDITYELDSLGASANAFTGTEYTGYYAKADVRHMNQILDIVADVYQNSTFPVAEIEKEKGVIVEEINMYADLPEEIADENLMKLLYGDQPAGWSIAGDIATVKSMTRKNFVDYHRDHYTASNTIIVIAGGIEHSVASLVKKMFSEIGTKKPKTKKKTKDTQTDTGIMIHTKETQQTHLAIGFRGYDMYHDDNHVASLIAQVLGSGMSSRLFQKLREDMGVCYYVGSRHNASTDTGIFKISAGVTNARIYEVVSVILDECKKLVDELVSDKELQKVRDMIRGRIVLGLESSDSWAMYYGGQVVYNKPLESIEVSLKKINKITVKDLQKIAKKIFMKNKLNISVVGPKIDNIKLQEIINKSLI